MQVNVSAYAWKIDPVTISTGEQVSGDYTKIAENFNVSQDVVAWVQTIVSMAIIFGSLYFGYGGNFKAWRKRRKERKEGKDWWDIEIRSLRRELAISVLEIIKNRDVPEKVLNAMKFKDSSSALQDKVIIKKEFKYYLKEIFLINKLKGRPIRQLSDKELWTFSPNS